MGNIQVVNIKGMKKGSYIYIGRGSVYGNRFIIGVDGNREECIALYKKVLWQQICSLGPLGKAVVSLAACRTDLVLGCYCKPKACHGDVIASCIRWLRTKA